MKAKRRLRVGIQPRRDDVIHATDADEERFVVCCADCGEDMDTREQGKTRPDGRRVCDRCATQRSVDEWAENQNRNHIRDQGPPQYKPVEREHPTWAQLLQEATTVPGTASTAYSMFHEYSFGNRMLAMWQAAERGLQPGPFGTFNFWLRQHRRVRKGEKAIVLCQPRTVSYAKENENTGEVEEFHFTKFTYPAHWFFLSQTEGDDYTLPPLPAWKLAKALVSLEVSEVPFTLTEGNVMGYAHLREYAINPLDPHPAQTLFHELAHIVLGHTEETITDTADRTPRSVREMEAEATAMLVADALDLKDHAESRGYIQGWYKEQEIPEASAHRIFHAADVILSAGLPAKPVYKPKQAKKPAKRRSTERVAVAA